MTHKELKDIIRNRTGYLGENDILYLRNTNKDDEIAIRVKCNMCGRTAQLVDLIFSKKIIVHGAIITYKESGNLFTVKESDIV